MLKEHSNPTGVSAPRKRRRFRGAPVNIMYLPALVLFAIFIIYPVINGIVIAATNWDGYSPTRDFVGFANFQRLFTDENFAVALRNTFIYGFGSTILQQLIALPIAVLLDRNIRGRGVMRAIIYLPALVSPVVMGTMYYLVFRYNQGALNDILSLFGGSPVAWLNNSGFAIAVIVLINSIQFVGISMIIYLSGLQGIPGEVKEAASLDGAEGAKQFFYITMPQLVPAFASSCVLNLIGGLKLYDIIQILTAGGPGYSTHSVSTLIGRTYFGNQAAGYAAAQGIILFLIIAIMTVILNLSFDKLRSKVEG